MKGSKYTKDILKEKVILAKNMSDLVRILTEKEKVHGSMTQYIKNKLLEYNIDFSHFEKGKGRNIVHKFAIKNQPYCIFQQKRNYLKL